MKDTTKPMDTQDLDRPALRLVDGPGTRSDDPGEGREFLMVDGEAVATWAAEHDQSEVPVDVVTWATKAHKGPRFGDRGRDAVGGFRSWLAGVFGLYRLLCRNSFRGFGRLLVRFGRWWIDHGYRSSKAALEAGTATGNLDTLNERHDRKLKIHAIQTLVGLLILVGAGGWVHYNYTPVQIALIVVPAGLVVSPLLGWFGTDDPGVLIARLFRPVIAVPKIDEGLVVDALRNVPGPLSSELAKNPHAMDQRWIQPPTKTRSGWEMVFDLPVGSVETCLLGQKQVDALAAGLRRDRSLVWPSVVDADERGHAGRCRLTVLRQPLRDAKMDPWPLLTLDRPRSVFNPPPVGLDHLGETVWFPAINIPCVIVGAIPKHGKTCFLIQYALGVAMDPRSDLWIFDGKADVDWDDVGELVAHRFVKTVPGDLDDGKAALAVLRELDDELKKRRKAKAEFRRRTGISSSNITEEMVNAGIGLHPLLVVVDETQTYFLDIPDKAVRDETVALVTRVAKQGRSFGVTMVLATQTIKDATIPTDISGTAGGRIALKTGGHTQSQQILGAGCTAQGFKPEELKNLADAGIGYVAGDGMGTKFTRFYHLKDDEGEVREAAELARRFRIETGLLTGHAAGDEPEPRDTITAMHDIAACWPAGQAKVSHEVLAGLLADYRPDKYGDWTSDNVSAAARAYGLKTVPNCRGLDGRHTLKGLAHTDILAYIATQTVEPGKAADQ